MLSVGEVGSDRFSIHKRHDKAVVEPPVQPIRLVVRTVGELCQSRHRVGERLQLSENLLQPLAACCLAELEEHRVLDGHADLQQCVCFRERGGLEQAGVVSDGSGGQRFASTYFSTEWKNIVRRMDVRDCNMCLGASIAFKVQYNYAMQLPLT